MTPEQEATRQKLCFLLGAVFGAASLAAGKISLPGLAYDAAEQYLDEAITRYPALLDEM